MNRLEKLSEQINNWFYYFDDYTSPAHTICDIAALFEERIKWRGLTLALPFKIFRNSLCEATCMMYKAHLENKIIRPPSKIGKLPTNWNKDIEAIWIDYISIFFLHDDFWYDLWNRIPIGLWEVQFPHFRIFIQNILLLYIQRDFECLEANNLIKQTDDGDYVDINDYEDNEYGDETI